MTTPCGALWSQARLRRASLPGQVHAHVVIGVSQSALGIFGDGSLLVRERSRLGLQGAI